MTVIKCPECGKETSIVFEEVVVGDPVHCICEYCGARFPFNRKEMIIRVGNNADDSGDHNDPVNSPSHYVGKIECIDYLRDKLTQEEFTGFCMGNVLKYSSRWRKKDGLQDLKKAKVYLEWAIEVAEKENANG